MKSLTHKHVYVALAALVLLASVFVGAPRALAQTTAQAAVCDQTYVVVAGDWLSNIAQKLLGDVKAYQQIIDATNAAAKVDTSFKAVADANVIEVGQKLCIPKGGAAAPAASPTTAPAGATPVATAAAPASTVKPLTPAQLGNATYAIQDAPGGTITLKDGKASVEVAPGSASKYTAELGTQFADGDLNGDGAPDAAAIVITSGGGSGTFYYVAGVPNNKGVPGTGATALLGDRIKVSSLAIIDDKIQVTYFDRKEGEPFTADPTVAVTKQYQLGPNNTLIEAQASAAPVSTTGFPGVYIMSSPAADASALLTTITLAPDGNAAMLSNYVGKGTINATGTWTQDSQDTATVTFTKQEDKNINDVFVFQLTGDKLVATQYNQSLYGDSGLTFYKATAKVSGTVSYLQKIALPDNAVVEVYLVDVTNPNAPGTYLSGISYTTHGKQVPLPFEVLYAPSQIVAGDKYIVQAFISADGKLLFKNSNGVAVITNGAPTSGVDIVVEQNQ